MSIAEKLTTIAENEPRVYEAGKTAERETFWERFQDGGNRNAYPYAFRGAYWTDAIYHPRYPIMGDMQQVFIASGITDSKVPIVVNGSISSGFQGAMVKTIPSLDLTGCTACSRAFYNASALESVTFVGLIKINELNLSYSPKLNVASLISLLDCLEEKTDGGEWEVTLGTTNKNKLLADADGTAALARAEAKGWEIA